MSRTVHIALCALVAVACSKPTPPPQNPKPSGPVLTVLVKAEFKTADAAANKAVHDQVAQAGQKQAQAAGDLAHLAFLDAKNPQGFLAIDLWSDAEGMKAFFANPDFQKGFADAFAGPPEVSVWAAAEGFSAWGELKPQPGSMLVTVRGKLAAATPEERLKAHNAVADGSRAVAEGAGDYAHLGYLHLQAGGEFLAIDLWNNPEGMQKFFSDPNVQAAFASLFAGPPTITVYTTSDLYQY